MDNQANLDRRGALGAMALLGAAGAFGAQASAKGQPAAGPGLAGLGWDSTKSEYILPPLPYDHAALEPHIDAQTMQIHHDKHHAAYVKGLNTALTRLAEARQSGDASLITHWSRQVSFHGSGHVNHTLFWLGMAPAGKGGGGEPSGSLRAAIERDFGSFEKFSWQFREAAKAVEGAGWGWLVFEPFAGRLAVIQGENQQKLMLTGSVPLLGLDVWEHAYYLKYQNRRADYVDAFMNVVNWGFVQERFSGATA